MVVNPQWTLQTWRDLLKENEAHDSLALLEGVAAKLGIEVRYEILNGDDDGPSIRGGYCRVRERHQIIVESRLNTVERCVVLAESLSDMNLERVFIPPGARAMIERAQRDRRGQLEPTS